MPRKSWSTKTVDVTVEVKCAAGPGKIREEVWVNELGKVVHYNLAFINHYLCRCDNGRVLGYDAAHEFHHRHYLGRMEAIEFLSYEKLSARFYKEVNSLRKKGQL